MKCPTCGKPVEWKDNPFRPFCSERCQLVDLGKWVEGEYRVAGEPLPQEQNERWRSRMTKKSKAVLPQRRKDAKERKFFAPLRLCGRILLCGVILITGCNATDTTNSNTPVISGAPPGTTFPMPPTNGASITNMGWELSDGKRSLFSEYKGKVLVLDFYATWCVPCRDSIPHLIGLQKKHEDKGLVVVGLNVGGPGDDQEVPAFAKEFGIQYTLAIA